MTVNPAIKNAFSREDHHDPDYITNNRTFNPYQAAPMDSGATVEEFNTWTRLQKLDYLSDGSIHDIPSSDGSYSYSTFASNGQVFIIELLQKSDISGLSADAQTMVIGHPAWPNTAARLELVSNSSESDTAKSYLTTLIAELKSTAENPTFEYNHFGPWDGKPFSDQLDIIGDRLADAVIFSKDEYEDEIKEIEDRFKLLLAVYDHKQTDWDADDELYPTLDEMWGPHKKKEFDDETAANPTNEETKYYNEFERTSDSDLEYYRDEIPEKILYDPSNKYADVHSTDQNLTYSQMYETLLAQEKAIVVSLKTMIEFKENRMLFGFEMTVSILAVVLMWLVTEQTDIKLEMAAQKMRLHNWWLQEVGKLQDIMQDWLSHFKVDNVDQKRNVAGVNDQNVHLGPDSLSQEDQWVIAMFDDTLTLNKHPMTEILGITVPTIEFFSPATLKKDGKYLYIPDLPKLATLERYKVEALIEQIENYITQVNAQAQVDQNAINTQQQRKGHFMEFASNQWKTAENTIKTSLTTF